MEKQNQKNFPKEGKAKTVPQLNNYSQLLKTFNNSHKANNNSNIVRSRESAREAREAREAPSSTFVANNASGISENHKSEFKKLREEINQDTLSTTAFHRLPVQPAPYKRVAQEALHHKKAAPALLCNARDVVVSKPSPTEGDPSPEHPTITCFVNGVNVTVDEARSLLNSYISPPTLVTEKSAIINTKKQLEQFYAYCDSFDIKILEISTNNKKNLLKEIEARNSNKNNNYRFPPPASSPDTSRRLIIDEAVVPASSTAHSTLPDVPPALWISPHLSSRRNLLKEPTAYFYKPVANTTSNESEIASKKSKNNRSLNPSSRNVNADSGQTCQTLPSQAVKRTASYEGMQMPPRKVSVPDYTNSDCLSPGNQERLIYRVEKNGNSLPVYENISPPPGQYGTHSAEYTEYGLNYDERQQFYGPRNLMWCDHRLCSPQHQEIMHPMLPPPYYMQRPQFIGPSVEMRQTYAVQNAQGSWYSPPMTSNTEQGVSHFYNGAEPISSAQMNLLAKQNPHFQRQLRLSRPGDPYFPI